MGSFFFLEGSTVIGSWTRVVPCSLLLAATLVVTLAAAPGAAGEERRDLVLLEGASLDPRQPVAVAEGLRAGGPGEGAEYRLVKFDGVVRSEQRRQLETAVERVYAYLPHDTFLVKLREGAAGPALAAAGVRWNLPYHPAYKISRRLAGLEGASLEDAEPVVLLVRVYPDANLDAVEQRLADLGAGRPVGRSEGERFGRLRYVVSRDRAVALRNGLARVPEVFYLDLESHRVLLNDTTVWVGQSGVSGGQTTPIHDHGILGQGQVVGVLDTGIDPDMCYFRDGMLGLPAINPCDGGTLVDSAQRKVLAVNFLWQTECNGGISPTEWDTHDHGSHVAGTVAGDNLANVGVRDAGDGMAPAAKLVIQDGGLQTDNCADLPGIGCPVVDLNPVFQQAYDQGARIHTNSWGDRENFTPQNIYSAGSEDADEFAWNHPDFLLFFAAGNEGNTTGTVLSPSTGKNVVAVGATRRGTSAEQLASFSSCGPAADGRIKPDVTVPGESIISANNDGNTGTNNCDTRSMSGTSMASPGGAGLAALIRQYFTDGWYPSGTAQAGDAFTPSAALVKAALIGSAQSMTSAGPPSPSNCQGWGRVLLDNALYFDGESRDLWVLDDPGVAIVDPGQTRRFAFQVSSGTPLKATLVWTDFPSTPVAGINLVDDLDLQLTGPAGVFRGNTFSAGESVAMGPWDRLNNVEQVLLANPPAGEYVVTVEAFNLPAGNQPFALVVTGDFTALGAHSLFDGGFESGDFAGWSAVASDEP